MMNNDCINPFSIKVLNIIKCNINLKKYDLVNKIIEDVDTSNMYDKVGLMQLWFENHYQEKAEQIGHKLNSLQRFRIRLKFPPPSNLNCKLSHLRFSMKSKIVLNTFTSETSHYPTARQKSELATKCNLSIIQISTWFANYRRRLKIAQANEARQKKFSRKRKAVDTASHCIQQKKQRALEQVCLRATAVIATEIPSPPPPPHPKTEPYPDSSRVFDNNDCSMYNPVVGSRADTGYWMPSSQFSDNYYQPPEYIISTEASSENYYATSDGDRLRDTQWPPTSSMSGKNFEISYFDMMHTSEAERNALEALLSLKTPIKI